MWSDASEQIVKFISEERCPKIHLVERSETNMNFQAIELLEISNLRGLSHEQLLSVQSKTIYTSPFVKFILHSQAHFRKKSKKICIFNKLYTIFT